MSDDFPPDADDDATDQYAETGDVFDLRAKVRGLAAELASEREAHETLCAEYERLSDCYADLIADIDARSCASVYFERALYAASDAFVLAVHDLTHAIMSDRGRGGVNPNPRRMKDAVKIIRDEMRKRGHQDEWNKLRDA